MSSSKRRRDPPDGVTALNRYVRTGIRSRQQLRSYLRRSGVSSHQADQLIKTVEASGLVDDDAAAQLWAGHWARLGYAWAAIRLRLEARGFPAASIQRADQRLGCSATDESRARELVIARRRRGASERARLERALASRGFGPDLIEQILEETESLDASRRAAGRAQV